MILYCLHFVWLQGIVFSQILCYNVQQTERRKFSNDKTGEKNES